VQTVGACWEGAGKISQISAQADENIQPTQDSFAVVNGQKHISNQAYSIYVMFVFPRNEHTLLAYEFFY